MPLSVFTILSTIAGSYGGGGGGGGGIYKAANILETIVSELILSMYGRCPCGVCVCVLCVCVCDWGGGHSILKPINLSIHYLIYSFLFCQKAILILILLLILS